MGGTGLEPGGVTSCNDNELRGSAERGAAECAALPAETASIDADLRELIAAWAELPAVVKAGILAMVRAGSGD
jgi:hypothetical protein